MNSSFYNVQRGRVKYSIFRDFLYCLQNIYSNILGWFLAVKTFGALGLGCLSLALIMSFVLLVAVSNERLARVNVYTGTFAGICVFFL
jgi:hypothetical protein